jgi:hypothetical protein
VRVFLNWREQRLHHREPATVTPTGESIVRGTSCRGRVGPLVYDCLRPCLGRLGPYRERDAVIHGTEADRSGRVFHLQTVGVVRHDADRPKMNRKLVVVVDARSVRWAEKFTPPL